MGIAVASRLKQIEVGAEDRILTLPLARAGRTSICTSGAAGAVGPS